MNAKLPETFGLDRLQTPIGTALLVTDADGALRALDWEDFESRMRELLRLQYGAPVLEQARAPGDIRSALSGYFAGDLDALQTIKWRVAGTPFQRKVWTALRAIPVRTTTSYGRLAAQLGMPRAMRAVGLANGSNPISVVVPCHRVIGANGSLTGYGGGLERKRWLLNRPVAGSELGRLLEVQTAAAPDFVWQLLDWTSRGDVVVIEWQTTRIVGGARFSWRGVDKFRHRAGKIIEERVYCDTAPLRALRTGQALEPITEF